MSSATYYDSSLLSDRTNVDIGAAALQLFARLYYRCFNVATAVVIIAGRIQPHHLRLHVEKKNGY